MKKIDLNGKGMKTLSFDSDGIYTVGTESRTHLRYWNMSDEEFKTLKSNVEKVCFPDINDGDLLYFSKNAAFPKLLLGRLDLSIKRTVKPEKCTKLVVNSDSVISKSDLEDIEYGYVIMVGGTDETDFNQIFFMPEKEITRGCIGLELMQKYFPGIWTKVIVFSDKVNENSIELINSNPTKITTVQHVAKYLNSKLPTLDEDSARTIVSLFKSSDVEQKKLAVNMFASFNVSPVLFDICEAIGSSSTSFDSSTRNSVNFKYLKTLIGGDISAIESDWNYSYWTIGRIVSKLFTNNLMTSDQKQKAWMKFYRSVTGSDYVRPLSPYEESRFDRYNMPYSYDPKRETSSGDSKMEGESV